MSEETFERNQKVVEEFKNTAERLRTPLANLKDDSEEFRDNMGESEKFIRQFLSGLEKNANLSKKELQELFSEIEKAKKEQEGLNSEFEKTASTISSNIQKPLDNLKDISKQVTSILELGIKGFSKGIAESIVLGKELKETFKSIGQTLAVGILQTIIEIIARESVLLAIEKAKTFYKQQQAMLSGFSNLSDLGSTLGFFKRASGGSVQKGQPYMVGERGAELFIPNQSGQITQSARGTDGGQTTVNFNINTVDASGFEELLIRSRGTITQLINSAVNERGAKSII